MEQPKTKMEILNERIINDRDEPITIKCMLNGPTTLTIGSFLKTGIVNKQTLDIAPTIHKDFLVDPIIELLFKMLNSKEIS